MSPKSRTRKQRGRLAGDDPALFLCCLDSASRRRGNVFHPGDHGQRLAEVCRPERVSGRGGAERRKHRSFPAAFISGRKLQDNLPEIAPGLEYTVNYGIFTVFSKPLFWLLDKIHNVVGNWGWSIVILTILIKAAFFKLTEAQYRSTARMRKLQPRIEQLKERYGDDRQRMSQAMMEMYKKEKVNPLGGCLPILVQIPDFYRAVLGAAGISRAAAGAFYPVDR